MILNIKFHITKKKHFNMANCYYHSVSSVKHFGGKTEDYQAIHDWFDESKKIMPDFRHRALRHHAEGCFACEEKFGTTITNSDGKKVPTRLIAERHIKEDLGFIPSMIDWFKHIRPQKFMMIGYSKLKDIE